MEEYFHFIDGHVVRPKIQAKSVFATMVPKGKKHCAACCGFVKSGIFGIPKDGFWDILFIKFDVDSDLFSHVLCV